MTDDYARRRFNFLEDVLRAANTRPRVTRLADCRPVRAPRLVVDNTGDFTPCDVEAGE